MVDQKETSIDIIHGEKFCTVCTTKSKYIEEIYLLKTKYPNEVKITYELNDSPDIPRTIIAQVPNDWFKFVRPPKKMNMTEAQRKERAERMKKAREAKNK